jgi:hypothetical protein
MTKTLLLSLTLLCSTAWLLAQSTGQTGSQPDSSSGQTSAGDTHGKGNETTLQGCLSSSGGNYVLTDASGMQYQLQGETSKLSSNVNKQIQVKGMASSGSASSGSYGAGASGTSASGTGTASAGTSDTGSSAGAGGSTSAGAGSAQMFNVSKVKKISDSCNATR